MAHMLEMIDNKASHAYAGETPWHGLGVQVSNDLTPAEMMTAAGCDWTVHEVETFAEFNGQKIPTGMKALVRDRDNKVLTQVGENWHPVQNADAFEFFADFVKAGDMEMNTAGSLKDGKMVWALAKVKADFTLFNGDRVESFLLFSNPHEYGKSIDVRFTPTRVVCNNTLTMALNSKADSAVRLNHRKQFDAEEVKRILGLADVKMTKYKEAAEYLGSKQVTEDVMKKYFGELLGTSTKEGKDLSRTAQRAMELVETQPGAEYAAGSIWQMFNAVTYLTNHELGRSADTRLQSAWYGANRKLNIEAMNKALELADAL